MPKTAEPLPGINAPAAPVSSKLCFKDPIRRYLLTVTGSRSFISKSANFGALVNKVYNLVPRLNFVKFFATLLYAHAVETGKPG